MLLSRPSEVSRPVCSTDVPETTLRIRTLLPMACDGVGPSETCLNLARGATRAGYWVDIFANRSRIRNPSVPMTLALPGPFAQLPHRWIADSASRRTERQFLAAVRPGDIAYLWPAASLEAHRTLYDRGIPIVLEGINTRMAAAKRILDAAYEAFGAPPAHGITQARIEEEEEKYHYASAIFAPNRHVAEELAGSPLEDRIIPASYGVDTSKGSTGRRYEEKGGLTFMFCGYACIRKGAHLLLEAWKRIPAPHKLQLVGRIEPVIAERYHDLLASDKVEVVGFVNDVHSWFERADVFVFPSLEEGGPQVTYEAAVHGLPIIASPMGSGRMSEEEGTMIVVDPQGDAALEEALLRVIESSETREQLGRTAQACVPRFDWDRVGAKRAADLEAFITRGV